MESILIRPTWAGVLSALLALYEDGNRAYARAELIRMAMYADVAEEASRVLYQIADMTDPAGALIDLQRDDLRAIARVGLEIYKRVPPPTKAAKEHTHGNRTH